MTKQFTVRSESEDHPRFSAFINIVILIIIVAHPRRATLGSDCRGFDKVSRPA
jgi:hypothetical protein